MAVKSWEEAARIEWADATKEDYCSVFGYFCDYLFDMQTGLQENADENTISQKCKILEEYCGRGETDGKIATLFRAIPSGTKIGAIDAVYLFGTGKSFYDFMLSASVEIFDCKMRAVFDGLSVFADKYSKGECSDMRNLKMIAGSVNGWISTRKRRLLFAFLALIVLGAAAFVALTVCEAADCLGPINGKMGWSDIASLFDMVVGATGFIWERVEDLRGETISREYLACTTDEERRRNFISTFGPYVEIVDSTVKGSGILALEGAKVKIHRSKIKNSFIYTSGTFVEETETERVATLSKAITALRKAQK